MSIVRPLTAPLLVFVAAQLTGCFTEPITGRSLLNLMPETKANEMGVLAYQQMLGEAKVIQSGRDADMLRRVGERISAVVDKRMADEGREPFQWEFNLIDAPDQVNAWALPGGKVAFYTGILPICQDETGIAVVMGHEVAHAYAQHGNARVSNSSLAQLGMAAVVLALGGEEADETSSMAIAALGVGYHLGVELPFSRGDESAADHIGLILMAEAGYDPRSAAAFWTRMQTAGGGGTAEFLSTHPSHATRIEQLEALAPEAMEIYRARSGFAGD